MEVSPDDREVESRRVFNIVAAHFSLPVDIDIIGLTKTPVLPDHIIAQFSEDDASVVGKPWSELMYRTKRNTENRFNLLTTKSA